ncbi:MAG TPA: amidohydrolase family protein [Burkholderiales bacterium]
MRTLLQGGQVWTAGERAPYRADVLVENQRIAKILRGGGKVDDAQTRDCTGCTLIPGLIDGHSHLSFAEPANFADHGNIPPEEHVLITMRHARIVLEAGFTSVLSAGAAKPRLDVVIRNAINAGQIPGPRMLAASPELTNTGNLGDERMMHIYRESVGMIVDGELEMLKACRLLIREGVDTLKLNVSGNHTVKGSRQDQTIMTEIELATAARTAHAHGKRLAVHTRAAESILLALKYQADILYHLEFADARAIDALEEQKERIFVAPAFGLLHNTIFEAEPWGITRAKAEAAGMMQQFEGVLAVYPELKRRGVRVLVGGDYGFPWTPHGTNARDLEHFVKFFGYTPVEALTAATKTGAAAMMMEGQTGEIREGFYADIVAVEGDPTQDVRLLQDKKKLKLVMKDGRDHTAAA